MLAILAACGSGSKKRRVDHRPPLTHTYEGEHPLLFSIQRIEAVGKRKITVRLTIRNDGRNEVRFKRSHVSLLYKGRTLYARDVAYWEADVNVVPGQTRKKYWAFHTEEDPAPGEYELKITGIAVMDEGGRTPTGKDFTFRIPVP